VSDNFGDFQTRTVNVSTSSLIVKGEDEEENFIQSKHSAREGLLSSPALHGADGGGSHKCQTIRRRQNVCAHTRLFEGA